MSTQSERSSLKLLQNQPLAKYSTYNIGGPADYFIEITTLDELRLALQFANDHQLPLFPLGKGSNTLFPDAGFRGMVLLFKLDTFAIKGSVVTAGAGFSFSLLGIKTAKENLSGLEFASGIPGSVGGAVFMNAGAGGSEVQDTLQSVTTMSRSGTLKKYRRNELTFSYRTSPFQKKDEIIVEASFLLVPNEGAKQEQSELLKYRMGTQPYKAKTIGCTFRNPVGGSAGKLIETCGLKGYSIGGARVSPMHANFIENYDNATAEDVLALIKHIEKVIKQETGIQLEREIRTISPL